MKKTLHSFFVITTFILIFSIISAPLIRAESVSALESGFQLSYWYSNSTHIGHRSNTSFRFYVSSVSNYPALSANNLASYVTNSTGWRNTLNTAYTRVYSSSSANLQVRGEGYGYLPDGTVGLTKYEDWSEIEGEYNTTPRVIRLLSDNVTVILGENLSYFSTDFYQKVMAHELTHALGYIGHYNIEIGGKNLMNTNAEMYTGITPNSNEILHLTQMY